MKDGYIFAYADAQKTAYPHLKFIQIGSHGFGIFQPLGSTSYLELSLDRVMLNEDGQRLQNIKPHLGGIVVDCWNDVVEFHKQFGLDYSGPPRLLDKSLEDFRQRFMDEEHKEFKNAKTDAERLDAICDYIYVALGYARLRGWNFPEAWRRVQAANMSKVAATEADVKAGKARHISDIIKPADFTSPDHSDLV